MAFCAQCGTENKDDSRFCLHCGAPIPPVQEGGSRQQGQAYRQSNYQQYQQPEHTYVPDGDARTLGVGAVSVLAYTAILFFVPLAAYQDSKFARFHAGQGLNLLLLSVAYGIVSSILSALFTAINVGLGVAIGGLLSVAGLVIPALMILGAVNVCKGWMKPLPVIGGIEIIKL
ncbi:MAG TPA: zinc-ribbon domain-containing protein [Feifaniaceae bacterium]|nr:zinc-ribbon domain-containing protein [Feifaniaceae bacterium]